MMLPLPDVAAVLGYGGQVPDSGITGWSIDTRTLARGDLFFALRGPNHDGHDYLERAFEEGAAAAVVERETVTAGVQIPVEDSCQALQSLAAWARRTRVPTVVAVTGSAGKTTTKDTIAHLLGPVHRIGKTTGNFNNHIGLPLSILRLPDDAEVAVLEIGMNHAGEIRDLAAIARPDIGVVTNVGHAHLENFDSIDGVARAKRELIDALPASGTAILNADDERVAAFAAVHPGPSITFGFSADAGIRATGFARTGSGTRFQMAGAGEFHTRLLGRHAILNILAGLAVARALGIEAARLRDAVATLEPPEMRGRRFTDRGITIFDDCYNSNPDAVRAMLETLRDTPARRRIAVLGEMRELGRSSEALHREIGRFVAACGVDVLVGIRGAARQMADAAVTAGLPASAAYFFSGPEQAGDYLGTIARTGDVILFKGSRGTRVELALRRFLSRGTPREKEGAVE